MNYPYRLQTVRQRMAEHGVDLLILPRGANLFYLTGIRRQLDHGTDHNAYGDWICGGYVGRDGPVQLVAPRMGGDFFVAEAEDKPSVAEVRLVQEAEAPREVLRQTLAGFGLVRGRPTRIAVDDRLWAQAVLALRELLPDATVTSANDLIAPLRMIKKADELAALRRASDLTDGVWTAALAALKPGVTEYEVAHEIDDHFVRLGA